VQPPRGMATWVTREVYLPGRGLMTIREASGPAGAPTFVLLHGLAATGRLNWATSMGTLAERFHVIVVDHRGHGRGIRTRRFRLADCADDVVAMADALGVESLFAVGYSMGGPVAKLTWSRHPDRVRGLVLCATANHFARPEVRGVASAVFPGVVLAARLVPDLFRNHIIDRMIESIPDDERRAWVRQELAGTDPATIIQATRALVRFSSHDWASTISVPTAVVITTRDTLVPARWQYRLAASIPGARVFEVSGDHLACVRAADRFVPALLDACEYVQTKAGSRS